MITFFELGQLGRLGNQLFQYAALRSLSIEKGYEAKIPNPKNKSWHGQSCLLNNFNIEASYLSSEDLSLIQNSYSEPNYERYDYNFFKIPDNTNLSGFFQSTYYFSKHRKRIIKELTPKKELLEKAQSKIKKIKQENAGYEIVSLHMRRGDNTDNTDPRQVCLNNSYGGAKLDENSVYYKYFKNATSHFKNKKVKFLVFTGGKRFSDDNSDDILWCKENFSGDEFLFSEGNSTIEDFCLLSACDHHVLSHVSSFGWWGAYIDNKHGITIAPLKYDPSTNYNHRIGFYPKNWLLV